MLGDECRDAFGIVGGGELDQLVVLGDRRAGPSGESMP
jgi:hypothetical protein